MGKVGLRHLWKTEEERDREEELSVEGNACQLAVDSRERGPCR